MGAKGPEYIYFAGRKDGRHRRKRHRNGKAVTGKGTEPMFLFAVCTARLLGKQVFPPFRLVLSALAVDEFLKAS